MQQKKKRRFNVGSLIGWLIFILAFAGGPLLRLLRQVFSGSGIALPSSLNTLLPIAIGVLVVGSILVSVVRALGASRGGSDTRLPTEVSSPRSYGGAPMPPFAGPSTPRLPTSMSQPPLPRSQTPSTPGFEPIFNPRIVLLGIIGLVVLGALAFVAFSLSLP